MSLATKAAAGFLVTTAANIGSRFVTIISTFILTRFLAPEVQGEVNIAVVLVMTAGLATALGVSQFIAAHPKEGRSVAFHGSVLTIGAGAIACLACYALRHPIGAWLGAPGMTQYVPGLALSHMIDRVGWLPRNILVRDMRFRMVGARMAIGEFVYAGSSVGFAWLGFGGHAIVFGNLARASLGLLFLILVTNWRDYLEPARLQLATFRRLLHFGLPISISNVFHVGAGNWDNLFIASRFGEASTGLYNQAYRLADLPATNVGEQINDVLVPTFARLDDKMARVRGLVRAAGLMALVVFPMALGLGALAHTAVQALYPPNYQGVAPFLAILASLSMTRSLGVLATGYMQVVGRTRILVVSDVLLVVTLLGSMYLLAPLGEHWATVGVGIAFALNAGFMLFALRPEGVRVLPVLARVSGPLVASLLMAGALLGARTYLIPAGWHAVLRMLIELGIGAACYVGACFVVAKSVTRDFLNTFLAVLRRRKSAADD